MVIVLHISQLWLSSTVMIRTPAFSYVQKNMHVKFMEACKLSIGANVSVNFYLSLYLCLVTISAPDQSGPDRISGM